MSETLDFGASAVLPVGETAGKDAIPEEMIQTVEALLFAAHEPLPVSTLAPSLNGSAVTTIDQVVIVLNQRLAEARKAAAKMGGEISQRAQQGASDANEYVHEQPWKVIGVSAVVGLLLGFVLARRG